MLTYVYIIYFCFSFSLLSHLHKILFCCCFILGSYFCQMLWKSHTDPPLIDHLPIWENPFAWHICFPEARNSPCICKALLYKSTLSGTFFYKEKEFRREKYEKWIYFSFVPAEEIFIIQDKYQPVGTGNRKLLLTWVLYNVRCFNDASGFAECVTQHYRGTITKQTPAKCLWVICSAAHQKIDFGCTQLLIIWIYCMLLFDICKCL